MEIINFIDVKDVSTKEYFKSNEYAVDMFEKKYSHIKTDGTRETPAEVFWRIADELVQMDQDSGLYEYYRDHWFSLMYQGWFRPGGSIMSGIGSGRKSSMANCTTIPIEGDTIEAINKAEYVLMKCAAYRQGMGLDLSNLRPRGSKVGNAAEESTGVIPWAMKYSNVGHYVGQKGRMPAVLESLKIHHPDIEEFINCKRKNGVIENANISVQITDEFMESLENKEKWLLWFDTKTEKIRKEIDPEYLFDLIAEAAYESAEPGVQFIDRLKNGTIGNAIYKATGNKQYEIISTNACCFTGDMVVITDKGRMLISEIRKLFECGENLKILSYDIENDLFEFQDLENFHIRNNENPQEIIEVVIEKENGTESIIKCTADHKFYTKNRGWIKAIELEDNDELLEY